MAKYKTFDEYVKGEKIVRYIDFFKRCWNFATDAAEENGSSHNTGMAAKAQITPDYSRCSNRQWNCIRGIKNCCEECYKPA